MGFLLRWLFALLLLAAQSLPNSEKVDVAGGLDGRFAVADAELAVDRLAMRLDGVE